MSNPSLLHSQWFFLQDILKFDPLVKNTLLISQIRDTIYLNYKIFLVWIALGDNNIWLLINW